MTSHFLLGLISPKDQARIVGEEIARMQKEVEQAEAAEDIEWERELEELYGGGD